MALKVNAEIIKVSDGHLDHPENQGVVWLEEEERKSVSVFFGFNCR